MTRQTECPRQSVSQCDILILTDGWQLERQLDSQLSRFNPCFNEIILDKSLLYSSTTWISFSELSSPARRRCLNIKLPIVPGRKKWSVEETKWLEEGVRLYGEGNWAKILSKYNFVGRTSVNLKDRWRTLQKNKWCWKVLDDMVTFETHSHSKKNQNYVFGSELMLNRPTSSCF